MLEINQQKKNKNDRFAFYISLSPFNRELTTIERSKHYSDRYFRPRILSFRATGTNIFVN